MGFKRVAVPAFLFLIAIVLLVVSFSAPAGVARTSLMLAAGFDFLLGTVFLIFGVPDRRR